VNDNFILLNSIEQLRTSRELRLDDSLSAVVLGSFAVHCHSRSLTASRHRLDWSTAAQSVSVG